ncbi:MAG: hypothetical protein JST27_05640 [Bacteroidetes bacterium]|nr:hypothetical protein [Bacteroidota bacterium]
MHRIEVFIQLGLPAAEKEIENSKAIILAYLEGNSAFNNIMLIHAEGKTEAELSFCFEEPVSLNEVVTMIQLTGATTEELSLQLPSSLSGVADVYDARDLGEETRNIIQSIEGVMHAAVGNNGAVRVLCRPKDPDMVLKQAIAMLLERKSAKDV